MLELKELSPTWTLAIAIGVTAAVTWALTQLIKRTWLAWLKHHPKEVAPWFWDSALRAASLLIGAVVGWSLMQSPLGAYLGAGSGALNSVFVWVIRKRARALATPTTEQNSSSADEPTEPDL